MLGSAVRVDGCDGVRIGAEHRHRVGGYTARLQRAEQFVAESDFHLHEVARDGVAVAPVNYANRSMSLVGRASWRATDPHSATAIRRSPNAARDSFGDRSLSGLTLVSAIAQRTRRRSSCTQESGGDRRERAPPTCALLESIGVLREITGRRDRATYWNGCSKFESDSWMNRPPSPCQPAARSGTERFLCMPDLGYWSHCRPSSELPPDFGVLPPHCLKKNATLWVTH